MAQHDALGKTRCAAGVHKDSKIVFLNVIDIQVRLHLGIGRALAETPDLRVELVEPDRADAALFLANPMSLAARREILEGAYAQGRDALDRRELVAAA